MPQHRMELKSLRTSHRLLCCEPLEKRAMLTALIASAEIAPGPIDQFTAQARTFVESALEHVKATQHQTPVRSSMDSVNALAEDGRAIRIANYTVEMDDSNRLGLEQLSSDVVHGGNLSSGNQAAGLVAAPSMSGQPMRSSLVFSFLIYPDNSVSLRARWNAPLQWSGFAAGGGPLQATHSVMRGIVQDRDGWLSEGEERQQPVGTESEAAHRLQQPSAAERAGLELVERELGGGLLEVPAENERVAIERLGRADAVQAEVWDSLLGHWCVVEFVDGEAWQVAEAADASSLERGQPASMDAGGSMYQIAERQFASNHSGLEFDSVGEFPIPGGMIALDFVMAVEPHAGQAQSDVSASAIYQVFVHAAEAPQVGAGIDDWQSVERTSARREVLSLEPSDQPRWSTQALAWLAVAGGVVWAIRPQRGEPMRALARRTAED
jgi:hypothetical protein